MQLEITKASLNDIPHLRALFLQENNFQIRYNAVHERGWSDSYLINIDGIKAGYGSVKGFENHSDRDTIFEFYLIPACRAHVSDIFSELITVSGAKYIECQSNDVFLSAMHYEFSKQVSSEVILFGDQAVTNLFVPGVSFREKRETDILFEHRHEPEGSHVLELNGEVVGTGGFLLHYNKPFADLYMEIREDQRKKGLGSYLIQEVKKACYEAGRVPAARCNIDNKASKNTLLKAGMKVTGYMLTGELKK